MVEVKVKEGEPIDNAIRRFKGKCEKAGIMKELKKREYYISPSEKKKMKKDEFKRKLRKKQIKERKKR